MRKVQVSDVALMGPHTRAYTEFVRSAAFRRALEALTGFAEGALVNDNKNEGAGTHVTLPGAYQCINQIVTATPTDVRTA